MNPNNNPKSGMDNRILDTDYEILGYADKLSYTEMYRVLFYSLASLHRQSMRFEAIEMFNDCIGDFKPLWDGIFFLNYASINKTYSNAVDRYRLHRAELISLLQRAGMMDLPDLRYNAVPAWVVPENIACLDSPDNPEDVEDFHDFDLPEHLETLNIPENLKVSDTTETIEDQLPTETIDDQIPTETIDDSSKHKNFDVGGIFKRTL